MNLCVFKKWKEKEKEKAKEGGVSQNGKPYLLN